LVLGIEDKGAAKCTPILVPDQLTWETKDLKNSPIRKDCAGRNAS